MTATVRVGFDSRDLGGPLHGLQTYCRELVRELEDVATEKHQDFVHLRADHGTGLSAVLWEQIQVPRQLRRQRIDVYHTPRNYALPLMPARQAKLVVTVHDLITTRLPRSRLAAPRSLMRRLIARRADHIIAVSRNTKADIIKHLGVADDRITVIAEAPRPLFAREPDTHQVADTKARFGITGQYVLTIGTASHKNVGLLTKVIPRVNELLNSDVQLVVAGRRLADTPVGESSDARQHQVVRTGHVTDEDLLNLMRGSTLLCFPSLYEGFGLPPLEAMTAGIPVIASNCSSLPEVVGDGGILLSPHSAKDWVEAIVAVFTRQELRSNLVAAGKRQAASFSWRRAAVETWQVYERLFSDGRPGSP